MAPTITKTNTKIEVKALLLYFKCSTYRALLLEDNGYLKANLNKEERKEPFDITRDFTVSSKNDDDIIFFVLWAIHSHIQLLSGTQPGAGELCSISYKGDVPL